MLARPAHSGLSALCPPWQWCGHSSQRVDCRSLWKPSMSNRKSNSCVLIALERNFFPFLPGVLPWDRAPSFPPPLGHLVCLHTVRLLSHAPAHHPGVPSPLTHSCTSHILRLTLGAAAFYEFQQIQSCAPLQYQIPLLHLLNPPHQTPATNDLFHHHLSFGLNIFL